MTTSEANPHQMLTREQKYAIHVFDRVSDLATRPEPEVKKYGSMAHKLPILVRTAGLAQALAFVSARGEPIHHQLLADLAVTVGYVDEAALLNASRTAGFAAYLRLSQQVMAALLWYKRFAQSVLHVSPTADDQAAVPTGAPVQGDDHVPSQE